MTRTLRDIAEQALIEAMAATNALACLARAQYHHAEVARLHTAIGILKDALLAVTAETMGDRAGLTGQAIPEIVETEMSPTPDFCPTCGTALGESQ